MKVVLLILVLAFTYVNVNAHEPYCYDPALIVDNRQAARIGVDENGQTQRSGFTREATGIPAIALEKCPSNGWFHYYDCCNDNEDKRRCCFNFRWFFLLLFILPWVLLLLGLLGGLGGLFARKRGNRGRRQENIRNVHTFGNPNRDVRHENKEHARNIPIGGEQVVTQVERREYHEKDMPSRTGAFERTVY